MVIDDIGVKAIVYVYKGALYSEPPFSEYYVDNRAINNGVMYLTIRRAIPIVVHLFIWALMLIPIIGSIIVSYRSTSNQVYTHVTKVPNVMYYDKASNTIDLDISNDGSNFEVVSVVLYDSNKKKVLELNGILPGESIGSWPVVGYEFETLPMQCNLIYKTSYNGSSYKDVIFEVLVVDRSSTDKEFNNEF